MDFDTKIAIIVRDDLATWQKLNVTAFLTSGVAGADQSLFGEDYQDAVGNSYSPLLIQPIIVLSADGNRIKTIYRRAMDRGVQLSIYPKTCRSSASHCARKRNWSTRLPKVPRCTTRPLTPKSKTEFRQAQRKGELREFHLPHAYED